MAVELARRRFTVDEYQRMGEVGILSEDDRVELVDGEIVQMTPIGPRHVVRVAALHRRLQVLLGDRADIIVQSPIRLGPYHEPQPDITLLRPPLSRYEARLAGPDDILLVVEVADTSAGYDRGVKLPLYAAARIPEVWLVDLAGEAVKVYRAPAATGYRDARRLVRGDRMARRRSPTRASRSTRPWGSPTLERCHRVAHWRGLQARRTDLDSFRERRCATATREGSSRARYRPGLSGGALVKHESACEVVLDPSDRVLREIPIRTRLAAPTSPCPGSRAQG